MPIRWCMYLLIICATIAICAGCSVKSTPARYEVTVDNQAASDTSSDAPQKHETVTISVLAKIQTQDANGVPLFWIITKEYGRQQTFAEYWAAMHEGRSYTVEQYADENYGPIVDKVVEDKF